MNLEAIPEPLVRRRTVRHLDNIQHHDDAIRTAAATVLTAIADGTVTPTERRSIVISIESVRRTFRPLPVDAEHLHAGAQMIHTIAEVMELTPWTRRRLTEMGRDLERLDEALLTEGGEDEPDAAA